MIEFLLDLEKYFPVFKKKANINSISFTFSNMRKKVFNCRWDFLFIIFPLIKFQTFFQKIEIYISPQIFNDIFKTIYKLPKLLIVHSSNALKICEISKNYEICFSISINSYVHNNSTKVFIENVLNLIIKRRKTVETAFETSLKLILSKHIKLIHKKINPNKKKISNCLTGSENLDFNTQKKNRTIKPILIILSVSHHIKLDLIKNFIHFLKIEKQIWLLVNINNSRKNIETKVKLQKKFFDIINYSH